MKTLGIEKLGVYKKLGNTVALLPGKVDDEVRS